MLEDRKKETEVLESIAQTIMTLDNALDEIKLSNNESPRTREMKKWYEEKKAIQELKLLLHDIGKYPAYDNDELKNIEAHFDTLIN